MCGDLAEGFGEFVNDMHTKQEDLKLNLHYTSIQIPYWMGCAILSVFSSVFLLSRNFSNSQIGIVLSAANLLAAVSQPFVASFADRMQRMSLSQIAVILSGAMVLLSVALLVIRSNVVAIAVIYILLYALLMIQQPITIAIGTFFISRGYNLNFGLARGIGSFSFAVASTAAGVMLEGYSADVVLYFIIVVFAFLAIAAISVDTRKRGGKYPDLLYLEKDPKTENAADGWEKPCSLPEFIRTYKRFVLLLTGVSLIFVFHQSANSYMYQIMQNLGGTEVDAGNAVSIAAVSELPTMFLLSLILKKFRCKSMMRVAAIAFSLKSLMILFAGNIFIVDIAMSTQLLGFALHTAVSVYYVGQVIPRKDLVKGQALMTTANTVGGIIGSFAGGQMLNYLSVHAMILSGTILSIVGTIIICMTVEGKE